MSRCAEITKHMNLHVMGLAHIQFLQDTAILEWIKSQIDAWSRSTAVPLQPTQRSVYPGTLQINLSAQSLASTGSCLPRMVSEPNPEILEAKVLHGLQLRSTRSETFG